MSYIAVDMICSSNPDFVVNDTLWASEANTSLLDYMKSIPLSADYLNYDCKITAMDKQNNKTEKNFTVSVTALSDYTKMYLADVNNAEALTSDLLGVPMLIDHVGEFQYEARYYSKAPNTEIRFIPQKLISLLFVLGLIQITLQKLLMRLAWQNLLSYQKRLL